MDRRQRERELVTELERGDEREPPVDVSELADPEAELEGLTFPATGVDAVAAIGGPEVDTDYCKSLPVGRRDGATTHR